MPDWPKRPIALLVALVLGFACGCSSVPKTDQIDARLDDAVQTAIESPATVAKAGAPSNYRDWNPLQGRVATAFYHGNQVTIENVRYATYRTEDDYTVDWETRTYDLDKVRSVDFIVVPFPESPSIAHTMLSFGFEGDQYLVCSVETRKEKGEGYGALAGILNQYELIYILGDERDLIRLRTDQWMNDVYLYRTRATPEQAREIFQDVLKRVNQLAVRPEFYNTLTNNCTTNIRSHINKLYPDRIPYDTRVLFPGYADQLAYELDLLDTDESFERTRARSRINFLAYLYANSPDFSAKIRQNLRLASNSAASTVATQ